MTKKIEAYAVVLAGGSGTRFWPASTPERPKQLLPLAGDRPLVVETLDRATALVGPERVLLVAGEAMVRAIREAYPDLRAERCLVEPFARGTGPALAWAATRVVEESRDAVMVAMHADHLIEPFEAFRDSVARAIDFAREGRRLVCLAAPPDRPEAGYGYLRLGAERRPGAFDVEAFVEKPDTARAKRYLESGDYLWNTGIFVWSASRFLAAVEAHTPEIAGSLPSLAKGDADAFFEGVEPISVDVGVMERSDAVGAVVAEFRWDDVGVWGALARTRPADRAGNVFVGSGRGVESRDNIVWSETARVTLFGVEGLVVVESGGELLVTTRERAPRLKRLLERLERDAGSSAGPARDEDPTTGGTTAGVPREADR